MSDKDRSSPNTLTIVANGPLVLRGRFRTAGPDAPGAQEGVVELCRCGASGNKPYCDSSHAKAGFSEPGRCAKPPEPAEHAADGEVVLNPIANGPLRIDGRFELQTADNKRYVCGEKTWLCRCGNSGNKPFCDGTHKRIGFSA